MNIIIMRKIICSFHISNNKILSYIYPYAHAYKKEIREKYLKVKQKNETILYNAKTQTMHI
jgi:hypothetical protein